MSGYWKVTSRPLRVLNTVPPVSISASARIPSSLGSNRHFGSSNGSPPPSASIGWSRTGRGREGDGLRGGEERQPVGPRLHEVVLDAGVSTAVESEAHLRVGPLQRLVPPVIEDANLAGTVVPFGDRAFERSRTRADGPRSGRRVVSPPSRSEALGAPPTTRVLPRARGGRRSGAGSPDACGSRRSCPSPASRRGQARWSRPRRTPAGERIRRAQGPSMPRRSRPRSSSAAFFAADRGSRSLRRGLVVLRPHPEGFEGVREIHLLGADPREQISDARRTGPRRCRSGSPAARTLLRTPRPT